MALSELSRQSARNDQNLSLFRNGDERALTYFYKRTYDSLFYLGKRLVNDEFLVSCILHECYLKVWAYRDKIESLPHAYRFIRMNLRWQVLKQIQKPTYQIYKKMTEIDQLEPLLGEKPYVENYFKDGGEAKRWDEILEAISYLPKQRQLIANLHFQEGYSPQEVANRIGTSTLHVINEIQKSVEELKRIVAPRPVITVKQVKQIYHYDHILTSEQAAVFQLRQEQKKSFADIATILGYPQTRVQQHYIKAYHLVKNHRKQNDH